MKSQIYKDHWRAYLQLGLTPYPASNSYKGPIKDWKWDENNKPLPPPVTDDFLHWEEKHPKANIWVLLGNEFLVIDPDGEGSEKFVQSLNLPRGPVSISGKKSRHRWFKNSHNFEFIKVLNGGDQTFLEVRTGDLGMFVPPSIHPETGKPYQWAEGLSPWEVDFPEFPVEAYEKIKALKKKKEDSSGEPQMDSIPEGSLDVPKYLIAHNIVFNEKKEPTRTIYPLQRCLWAENHTTKNAEGDSAIIQGNDGKLGYQCFHNHCQLKTWADARRKISGDDSLLQFCKPKKTKDFGQPYGAFEIIEHPIEHDEHYIEPVMQAGDQGFLSAQYKTGKTNFMLHEVICLCCQKPFLGMTVPKARRVFYLRFELKESRFRERFTMMLNAIGGVQMIKEEPYFHFIRGFDIKKESDFSWILQTIDQLQTEVFMIDPFYKLSPSTKLREDEGTIYTKRFDELKERFPKLHIQVAHHPRKSIGGMPDNSWDSTYGSMFLFANMDYEIRISKKGHDKNTFLFNHISNDVPIESFTFKRNPVNLLYELETKEDTQNKWQRDYYQISNQVRSGLKTKGNLTTWITSCLKYTRREAQECIEYLLGSGQLEWVGIDGKHGKLVVPNPEIDDEPVE